MGTEERRAKVPDGSSSKARRWVRSLLGGVRGLGAGRGGQSVLNEYRGCG